MMKEFDYAILGGGLAGLSLALALAESPLQGRTILIVEKEAKDTNDHSWCFWTDEPTPFQQLSRRAWRRMAFVSDGFEGCWDISPYQYLMVHSLDFYAFAREKLKGCPVTWVQGEGQVEDGKEHVTLTVQEPRGSTQAYHAAYAFDSRSHPREIPNGRRYTHLKQHFLGWEVETAKRIFDPDTVTLFDLRTPQRQGVTFYYILPFSPVHALIEYTIFSPEVLQKDEYESALQNRLMELGAGDFRVLETESGVIPMTDAPLPRSLGRRILAIGSGGGRVKPSTGFAFIRIQRDCVHIVKSLLEHGHPFAIPPDPLRFRLQDSILLEVLAREPELGRAVLSAIFSRNPVQRVLKYLDDRSTFLEDISIMRAHPPGPFLRAIGRRYFGRVRG